MKVLAYPLRSIGRSIRLTLRFLLLVIVPCLAAFSTEPMTLEFAATEFPPMMGERLPYGGIITHIMREAFAQTGISIRLVWVPNNRAISGAMEGPYDGAYGWAHTPERARQLLYPRHVLYRNRMVFFHRRGEDYPWKKLEELSKYRIGVTIGNHYSDEFDALQAAGKLKIDKATADILGLRKLASGRIDLFPMQVDVGLMLADTGLTQAERDKIMPQNTTLWEVPVYVVIRRSHPKAQEIADRFDKGYEALESSGRLKAIIEEVQRKIREQTRKS